MVENTSQMFITGPQVVSAVTGEKVSAEELGGARTQAAKSGVAHFSAANDDECIEKNEPIRRIEVRRNITVDGEDEDDKWIRGYNEGIDDAIACIKSVPPVTPKGVTITDFADRCRECGRINPCEDCISREQTLKAFAEKCGGECACCEYNGSGYDNAENCKLIKSMPSVTPSRPKGKWIHWTDDYKDYVTCSCCEYGEEGEVLLSDKTPFCPNC